MRVEGVDYVRFPRRPRVRLRFFRPRQGDPRPDEDPQAMATRFLDKLRSVTSPVAAGRMRKTPGAGRRALRRCLGAAWAL